MSHMEFKRKFTLKIKYTLLEVKRTEKNVMNKCSALREVGKIRIFPMIALTDSYLMSGH